MNNEKIQNLRRIISEALTPLIVGDYVLLDVPNHCNIGDNLIWEGELQYLKQQIPYKCLYSANVENWEESKIKDADIILFHGGGNWGDLYRKCQDLRNYIANKYKNKRIIIFPQTVCYNDNSLLKEDCEIFENHPDIYICVRDRNSYEKLSRLSVADKDNLFFMRCLVFNTDWEVILKRAATALLQSRARTR